MEYSRVIRSISCLKAADVSETVSDPSDDGDIDGYFVISRQRHWSLTALSFLSISLNYAEPN